MEFDLRRVISSSCRKFGENENMGEEKLEGFEVESGCQKDPDPDPEPLDVSNQQPSYKRSSMRSKSILLLLPGSVPNIELVKY